MTGTGELTKAGAVLHFAIEETEYYETMVDMYRDILNFTKETIDEQV